MSMLDRLSRKKRAIPANATFLLTQEGLTYRDNHLCLAH
ncbi:hypothetical protein LCGC14_1676690 [marine sediment metagenome]|uniref:Uncharacterized protein n=1 Tax=marine sediment metagenome TaxID=412755 RepID=A0A0F9HPW3_9ZZZZ